MSKKNDTDLCATYATTLALTEIGIGSLLHACRVPLTGFFLSLNQIAILSHAVVHTTVGIGPTLISTTVALLKTLSPTGKKITPMIAITMQGIFFNGGLLLGGRSVFGRMCGAALAAIWGFIQTFIMYFCIFGLELWQASDTMVRSVLSIDTTWTLLFTLVMSKIVLAMSIALFAPFLPLTFFSKFHRVVAKTSEIQKKNVFVSAAYDLCRLSFLLPLVILIGFTWYIEGVSLNLIWIVGRPLFFGYSLFVLLRIMPLENIVGYLRSKKLTRFSTVFEKSLSNVQASTSTSCPTDKLPQVR